MATRMYEGLTLAEFDALAAGLPSDESLDGHVVAIEPLEGRNAMEVDRRCIVELPDGSRRVGRFD